MRAGPSHLATEDRVAWVDAAKGICIILVVMMHSTLGVGEAMGRDGFMHSVVAFAKPFRMPDFFLLSGLFLSRAIDRDWATYADRRVVHFAYFYILWLLIQSVVKAPSVSGGTPAGFVEHLAVSLVQPFGTLWFVYLLAVFSVVTKLARRLPPLLLLAGAAALEIAPITTGSVVIDEFCLLYVYFVAGYLFAPQIFALAEWARTHARTAVLGIVLWAAANGVMTHAPSGFDGFPTLVSLPVLRLPLGFAGALAIAATASLLLGSGVGRVLSRVGANSIAIYLAFFLPMAAARWALIRSGLIEDAGVVALLVTVTAVVVPLILARLVRGTPARFLFERPAWARLAPRRGPALQPAE